LILLTDKNDKENIMTIDLRSDTVTKPTEEMRKAMYEAEVGDDVYSDDPTVNALESLAAKILGKPAAVFVPSGTMGNLLALLSHTTPGQELIVGEKAHIHIFEVSGYARLAGLGAKIIREVDGKLPVEQIEENIQTNFNLHHQTTGLICIENTHNVAGGIVKDIAHMRAVKAVADKYAIPVHLDGARVFNAATYLGVDVKQITEHVDSVMMCLSKGLGAPVGSVLAGQKDFIDKARHNRKMIGGGMRQAGILAAAGIVALDKMPSVLEADHNNAKKLALGLNELAGFTIDTNLVHTNIVMADVVFKDKDAYDVAESLKNDGILTSPFTKTKLRFTTNHHIKNSDIDILLEKLSKI
jgi:threonine aldolase